ncbi:hypothetical protein Pmani_021925 [Petrolisthes manimaculis]|uniref:Transcription factor TFIIIC triple barrel domain-containing protein n=1 Tax=Petrolisthes manimaculis TaxID=1843537 RepID=A0AAE1PDW8_9EUCA|nr:hypothetical protein Pmani_021925 [Petrolisthes manimaculis]
MDSDEEEEMLVMVELNGVIDSEIFAKDSFDKFKVLAIDSERPILQVENFVFSGGYDHTRGTAIFFEEEEKKLKCDPVFCKKPPRMLKYVCKTNKKLTMKRVFVSEKQAKEGDKKEEEGNEMSTSEEISSSSQQKELVESLVTEESNDSEQ